MLVFLDALKFGSRLTAHILYTNTFILIIIIIDLIILIINM